MSLKRILWGLLGSVAFIGVAWAATATYSIGTSGGPGGQLQMFGSTSGSTTVVPTATAGTTTLTLPAVTDTFAVLGTAQTFTAGQTISNFLANTGTALPTQAAGTLGIGGEATAPTLAANGEGDVYLTSTTGGLTVIGKGSTNDITVLNSGGTSVCTVATGTTNWNCTGLQVGGTAVLVSGGALGTPSSGTATNLTGLPVGGIASIGTNTIVANVTSGSASPTAVTVSGCSAANDALIWTTNTGPGCSTSLMSLSATGQTFSGGVNLTVYSIGVVASGTTTVNCGNGPGQWMVDGGASTFAAPTADGQCTVHVINGGSFGTITISGFREGTNKGDTIPTTDISTNTATFTNSSASIGVTNTAIANDPVYFTNSGGALPTNFTAGTVYYVLSTSLSTSNVEVAATPGGTAITAGSAGTGTQTMHQASSWDFAISRIDGMSHYLVTANQ